MAETDGAAVAAAASGSAGDDAFTVVSYNILAKSLGSNCIPWVMELPAATVAAVDASLSASSSSSSTTATSSSSSSTTTPSAAATTWAELKSRVLTTVYRAHFHRNRRSGAYERMRAFWGQAVDSAGDIPSELTGVSFVAVDTVEVPDSTPGPSGDGVRLTTKTLRGLLRERLEQELADRVFSELVRREADVYDWSVRGPRIFQAATTAVAAAVAAAAAAAAGESGGSDADEDEGVVVEGKTGDGGAVAAPGDVLVLQEYDVHDVEARYAAASGASSSFRQAMREAGYDGLFLRSPEGNSGLGVFWRRARFALDVAAAGEAGVDMEAEGGSVVPVGSVLGGGAVRNVDLEEEWHPKGADPDGPGQLMVPGDRRHAGLIRLKSALSSSSSSSSSSASPAGVVHVVALHLMTTSRDRAGTTAHPGEVRAMELRRVRELVAEHVPAEAAVVVAGDFNTQPGDERVFSGDCDVAAGRHDTGFDKDSRCFQWGDAALHDVFAGVHRWRNCGKDGLQLCTSASASRTEWIDYIWHTPATLRLEGAFGPIRAAQGDAALMPSTQHPSDHVPVAATFSFLATPSATTGAAPKL